MTPDPKKTEAPIPLTELHHCSIRTEKLEETRDFYVDILGMEDGERPSFNFSGHWLYVEGKPVVHLVGIDPDNPDGLAEYLGEKGSNDTDGTGAIDHIAFNSVDPEALIALLKKKNLLYRERKVTDLNLFQVFLEDPNGVTLEINYYGES